MPFGTLSPDSWIACKRAGVRCPRDSVLFPLALQLHGLYQEICYPVLTEESGKMAMDRFSINFRQLWKLEPDHTLLIHIVLVHLSIEAPTVGKVFTILCLNYACHRSGYWGLTLHSGNYLALRHLHLTGAG